MEGYGNENPGAFQPTRPLRGATLCGLLVFRSGFHISTHAPLAGRDVTTLPFLTRRKISTHAPLAGRDRNKCEFVELHINFNPRAPCGARQIDYWTGCQAVIFQPTRPLRGATFLACAISSGRSISTHAPLAGRDNGYLRLLLTVENISTHAPLAGRDRSYTIKDVQEFLFQPTRPLRGATDR